MGFHLVQIVCAATRACGGAVLLLGLLDMVLFRPFHVIAPRSTKQYVLSELLIAVIISPY